MRRVLGLGNPCAVQGSGKRFGGGVFAAEVGEGGFRHHPILLTFEPIGEEAHHFVHPIYVGAGVAVVGEGVGPVTNDGFTRGGAMCHHAEDGVGVAVVPAADEEHGTLDAGIVRGKRASAPVGAVGRVFEPFNEPGGGVFEALFPLLCPMCACVFDLGGHGVHADLTDGVLGVFAGNHAPADVMHIVGIAVVGGVHGDDGFEVRGLKHGNLDGREAAVAFAPHADVAIAPGLGGKPFDRVVAVLGFCGGVFVAGQALAGAGAADVQATACVPALGQVGHALVVGDVAVVVFAVGDHFQHDGEFFVRGARLREPEVGGEGEPVAGGEAEVVVGLERVKIRHRFS